MEADLYLRKKYKNKGLYGHIDGVKFIFMRGENKRLLIGFPGTICMYDHRNAVCIDLHVMVLYDPKLKKLVGIEENPGPK